MTILVHRVETEQQVAKAEQRRVIAERAAADKAARRVPKAPARTPIGRILRRNVETREA
ncbi:hypothetical protein ACFOU1_01035 [Microbacterium sp. GCM10011525]